MAKNEITTNLSTQAKSSDLVSSANFSKITSNLGGFEITPNDLYRIKFPSAGNTTFSVEDPFAEDGLTTVTKLECVILHHSPRRASWKNPFTGEGNPPDCTSSDLIIGKGDPGGECRNCELNKWGSGKNGGKGCRELDLLFILLKGRKMPVLLQLPPTSLQAFKSYAIMLGEFDLNYWEAGTIIGLATTQNKGGIKYSKSTFKSMGKIDQNQIDFINNYRKQILGIVAQTDVYEDQSE